MLLLEKKCGFICILEKLPQIWWFTVFTTPFQIRFIMINRRSCFTEFDFATQRRLKSQQNVKKCQLILLEELWFIC